MKNLLTVTPAQMELYIPSLTVNQIKDLLRGIYEYKTGQKLNMEQILDIERKETKLWSALQNRGYLKKENYNDFYKWLYGNKKKKFY